MGMVGAITAVGAAIGAPFGSAIGKDFGWRNGILAFGGIVFLGAIIFYLRTAFVLHKMQPAPTQA